MQEKKYLVLRGLEGNPPADELNTVQKALEPYVDYIIYFWWSMWWGILIYMIVGQILVPLLRSKASEHGRSSCVSGEDT